MEVAICLNGVLEVVATRHILQRPWGTDYNLRTPLEKKYLIKLTVKQFHTP
jgi:hypothetical protein